MADATPPPCETCRFMDRAGEHGGLCRRYPAQVNYAIGPNDDVYRTDDLPGVGNSDWCGEHKLRDVEKSHG